jgi:uncharacterized protein YwgA
MPKDGAESIIAAIIEAMGDKRLNINRFEDGLILQKGYFILNSMGALPKYNFSQYIRGPYSRDLADDCYELLKNGHKVLSTDVPARYIEKLSDIISKGTSFMEAYTTLELARIYNPRMRMDELVSFVTTMEPRLKQKVEEASEYLVPVPSVI